jgi:hypothetical protein
MAPAQVRESARQARRPVLAAGVARPRAEPARPNANGATGPVAPGAERAAGGKANGNPVENVARNTGGAPEVASGEPGGRVKKEIVDIGKLRPSTARNVARIRFPASCEGGRGSCVRSG